MDLFAILNCMFSNSSEYSNVLALDKRRNFFMIQRRLAIGHPLQANALNNLKINPEQAVDIWQRFLIKQYHGKIPGWIYTKGIKKAQEAEEKKVNITFKDMKDFAKKYNYDLKSVKDAILFFPKELKKEIDNFIDNEKIC